MSSNLNFPSSQKEVLNRALADFQNELQDAGPYLKNSFILALLTAFAGRNYDNYDLLRILILQLFPDTASGEFEERWGAYKNINPLEGQTSSGLITLTGLNNTSVLTGSEFQTSDARLFKTQADAVIALQTIGVSSLVRSSNVVTVNTNGNHQLATGVQATITGANQDAYNGTFQVIVTADNQFTYTIDSSSLLPVSPATGAITVSFYGIQVQVVSETSGAGNNLPSGTELTQLLPLSGVDPTSYVSFDGITGGLDSEDTSAGGRYSIRVKEAYQNPIAPFNIANIIATCKELLFVKNVFVQPTTPSIGQVTVYFTKDISTGSTIPTTNEANVVKALLVKKILPAHVDKASLILAAPQARPVNFTISNLLPNTVSMQNAIKANLQVLFNGDSYSTEDLIDPEDLPVAVGKNLVQAAYESAIYQTVDPVSGTAVKSFVLVGLSGDVIIASNQLPTLGQVTFI